MKSEIVKRLLEKAPQINGLLLGDSPMQIWRAAQQALAEALAEDAKVMSGFEEEMGFHFSHKHTSFDNRTCIALDFRPIHKAVTMSELLDHLNNCQEPWAETLKKRIAVEGLIP